MDYHRKLDRFRYYLGTTAVTVVLQDGEVLARGIAVCSQKDRFDLKTGDNLSYERALLACDYQNSQEPLALKEAKDEFVKAQYIYLLNAGYKYFSEYKPIPLPVELQIMGKINWRVP